MFSKGAKQFEGKVEIMAYDHTEIMDTLFESGVIRRLTMNAFLVYLTICRRYNWHKMRSDVSLSGISKLSGVPYRTCQRAIKKLRDEGLIVIKQQANSLGLPKNYYLIPDYLLKQAKQSTKYPNAKMTLAKVINAVQANANPGLPLTPQLWHINYIINYNKTTKEEFKEPDYMKQMREALIASGRY